MMPCSFITFAANLSFEILYFSGFFFFPSSFVVLYSWIKWIYFACDLVSTYLIYYDLKYKYLIIIIIIFGH